MAAAPFSDEVWSLGSKLSRGGFILRKWTTSKWRNMKIGAVSLSVQSNGNVSIVQNSGKALTLVKGKWKEIGTGCTR